MAVDAVDATCAMPPADDADSIKARLALALDEMADLKQARDGLTDENAALRRERTELENRIKLERKGRSIAERRYLSMVGDISSFDIDILETSLKNQSKSLAISEFECLQLERVLVEQTSGLREALALLDEERRTHEKQQEEAERESNTLKERLEAAEADREKYKSMLKLARATLVQGQSEEGRLKARVAELEQEVQSLLANLENAERRVPDSEELDELQKLLDDVRQENNDMRLEIAAASGIIAENEKLKEKLRKQKTAQQAKLDTSTKHVEKAIEMCDQVTGTLTSRRGRRKSQVVTVDSDDADDAENDDDYDDNKPSGRKRRRQSVAAASEPTERRRGRSSISSEYALEILSEDQLNKNSTPVAPQSQSRRKLMPTQSRATMFRGSPAVDKSAGEPSLASRSGRAKLAR
ncbi:unnamed protein product (mitochondrion) [Plasmodiophora brassicae]|uniref:Uncharacterized protein n=1 Tax=Plasmodiophora brassicae TaxID=37360 RepID=A0A3P3YDP3_PLABS|nr:unnamed protein product [Plasmodiophora brassicae]